MPGWWPVPYQALPTGLNAEYVQRLAGLGLEWAAPAPEQERGPARRRAPCDRIPGARHVAHQRAARSIPRCRTGPPQKPNSHRRSLHSETITAEPLGRAPPLGPSWISSTAPAPSRGQKGHRRRRHQRCRLPGGLYPGPGHLSASAPVSRQVRGTAWLEEPPAAGRSTLSPAGQVRTAGPCGPATKLLRT